MPSRVSHSAQSSAWIFLCLQRHRDAIERQRFAVGIHPHRHRGAGAKARQHEIIRPGPGVLAAGGDGFVGQHLVRPDVTVCWNCRRGSRAPRHCAVLRRVRGRLGRKRFDIAFGPGGDDVGDIGGIALVAEQMIGAGQRHETLGMLGGDEDIGGVVDPDGVVGRRMHDQQRLVQFGDMRHQAMLGDVVEEFALDVKRPSGELHFDLALRADVLDPILEQMRDMGGIGGRGDGDDRLGIREFVRRRRGSRHRRGCGRSGSSARCRVSRK